ncbi:MAG: biotin--[acetyl-CoA-carboxylase] ligase [Gammaproteobacteria bacterium]|nr:biotin--[acetyl-CoA-carboxylase] ligase [Gammaproteobacteria bacterium]
MQPPASPFESARLLEHLPAKIRRRIASLCVLDTTASTSDELLARAGEDAGKPAAGLFDLCLAQSQTAGRGRFGNTWVSPPGGGVYLSAAWRASVGETRAAWLGLMTASALARRLQKAGVRGVGVKWPNDLYCDGVRGAGVGAKPVTKLGAKLGGVLVERRGSLCVAGVGVNVSLPARAGAAIERPWTTLAEAGLAVSADGVAAMVVEAIVEAADCVASAGIAAMAERFAPLDFLNGRPVEVVSSHGSFSGVAKGVNREARLRVQAQGGIRTCRCEEVSVRL